MWRRADRLGPASRARSAHARAESFTTPTLAISQATSNQLSGISRRRCGDDVVGRSATAAGQARLALEARVRGESAPDVSNDARRRPNRGVCQRACDVGCAGARGPRGRLVPDAVARLAQRSPRKTSLPADRPPELPGVSIELSVLTPTEIVTDPSQSKSAGTASLSNRAVAAVCSCRKSQLSTAGTRDVLAQTCVKAGLPASARRHGATIRRFQAEVFGEASGWPMRGWGGRGSRLRGQVGQAESSGETLAEAAFGRDGIGGPDAPATGPSSELDLEDDGGASGGIGALLPAAPYASAGGNARGGAARRRACRAPPCFQPRMTSGWVPAEHEAEWAPRPAARIEAAGLCRPCPWGCCQHDRAECTARVRPTGDRLGRRCRRGGRSGWTRCGRLCWARSVSVEEDEFAPARGSGEGGQEDNDGERWGHWLNYRSLGRLALARGDLGRLARARRERPRSLRSRGQRPRAHARGMGRRQLWSL